MDTVKLFRLKQELNAFLDENPHLKPLQLHIDGVLKGADNQNNRNVLLHRLMMDSMKLLSKELNELLVICNQYRKMDKE